MSLRKRSDDILERSSAGNHDGASSRTCLCQIFWEAYGYCFEEACLYAESMGIGTVMLAASLSRQTFEKAMHPECLRRIRRTAGIILASCRKKGTYEPSVQSHQKNTNILHFLFLLSSQKPFSKVIFILFTSLLRINSSTSRLVPLPIPSLPTKTMSYPMGISFSHIL